MSITVQREKKRKDKEKKKHNIDRGNKKKKERTGKKNYAAGMLHAPIPIILQNLSSLIRSRALVNMSAAMSAVAQYGMTTFDAET